jgi:class 3 adenylate cyclase
VSLLQRLDQERLAAPYLLTRGRCKWERARPDLAAEDYERARAILEPQGPSRELAAAYIRIAGLAAFQLDDRGCVEAATKAVKFAKQVGATDVYAWALGFVGLGLIGGGEVDRGLSKMVEAFEAAKGVDYAIASNTAWNEVWTRVHLMAPGIQEALDRLEEADRAALSGRIVARTYVRKAFGDLVGMYDDARKAHSALLQANAVKMAWRAALSAAEALAEMGRFDEAAGYLPEASSRTEVQDLIYDCGARVRYHLGSGEIEGAVDEAEEILEHRKALAQYAFVPACGVEVFATVGRLDDAKTLVESMLNRSHPYGEGCVEVSRARLALVKGDLDGARKLASSASTHFQRVGFKLEELRARTLLGEAIARLGDRDAGGRELAAVLDEALAINARLIADDALRRAAEARIDLVGSIAGTEAPPATAAREVPSLPGERLVTVMFADVRGYTAMTAASSPKEVSDKIATLQRWAKHEIERHGGVVDKFAGDAVMATFNFSGATIDHCEHAFQAALALRDKGRLIGLPLGIGIAVGPAIVGALAAGGNLSVLGETTNLAARLQSAAQGGEILLSEEAADRVRDLVKRSGGETVAEQLSVKGLDDPVAIVRFR